MNKVDAHSIYRIASVSKLITTFAGLVEMTEADWNRPLAEIIPGLGSYARANAEGLNPLYNTQWDKITPWALATQLSGVATLGYPIGDLAEVVALAGDRSNLLKIYGLPSVNVNELGSCATNFLKNTTDTFCSGPEGIAAVRGLPPNFLPWKTPAYSDEGFMLLGIAISNISVSHFLTYIKMLSSNLLAWNLHTTPTQPRKPRLHAQSSPVTLPQASPLKATSLHPPAAFSRLSATFPSSASAS